MYGDRWSCGLRVSSSFCGNSDSSGSMGSAERDSRRDGRVRSTRWLRGGVGGGVAVGEHSAASKR